VSKHTRMTAFGRKQPFKTDRVSKVERPLLVKADIQSGPPEIGLPNDRFTPESSRWSNIAVNDRL